MLIFLKAPSVEALRDRLIHRNTESFEKIEKRLARLDYEYSLEKDYDYVVINDKLEKTYNELMEIIRKESE